LLGVLAGHQNRLANDQELLLDGHRRLADAQLQFGTGVNGHFPAHLVAVVSGRAQISELSAATGALVIRAPVIIAALREYFEMLWETGDATHAATARATGRPADGSSADGPGANGRRPAR
jgi:hypothetical protein